jgi:acyl-CoA thioesterase II
VVTVGGLLRALTLEETGPGRYRAENADFGSPVIFGGQLLAQSIVAAVMGQNDKRVKTVHTIFARSGAADKPLEITLDSMHSGRAFASSTVTMSQNDRLCARSLVLLSADESDFIRHSDQPPVAAAPNGNDSHSQDSEPWQVSIVGDVDIDDPQLVGPPTLDVWSRFVGVPDDAKFDQPLVAFATDSFLIGTAMRPHVGVGQAQAHHTLSTGVISHTLTFHETVSAQEWLLMTHRSVYAGHGRCYGRADVYRDDGVLAASFVQDGIIRPAAS